MKAIIVDIDGKYAVAMDKKGAFIKVKNNGQYQVGYEIEIPSGVVFNLASVRKIAAIAAALVFISGIGMIYTYNKPYSYINVDINPSVELTTNIFDRVIDVKALNDDGTKIIENSSCKNKDIKAGIEIIIKNALEKGYLKDSNTSAVMFTVSSKSESKIVELKEEVQSTAELEFKEEKVKPDILVENVTINRHDEAIKLGVSPGKMLLIQKLMQTQPDTKAEDLKDAPVKEIVKKINEARKDNKKDKERGNNNGQGKGVQVTPATTLMPAYTSKQDSDVKEPRKGNEKDDKEIDKNDDQKGNKVGQSKGQEVKKVNPTAQYKEGTKRNDTDKKDNVENDAGKNSVNVQKDKIEDYNEDSNKDNIDKEDIDNKIDQDKNDKKDDFRDNNVINKENVNPNKNTSEQKDSNSSKDKKDKQ